MLIATTQDGRIMFAHWYLFSAIPERYVTFMD